MHRVDAELTADLPISPIDTEVAVDGIDHVVHVMWAWAPREVERRVTGTLDLRAIDTGHRWLVNTFRWTGTAWGQSFVDQIGCEPAVTGEVAATVSGTSEDLDLFLWTRADRNIASSGDERVLREFGELLADGIH